MAEGIVIALVGLNFGRLWVPYYAAHPDVADVVLCDAEPAVLAEIGAEYGLTSRLRNLDEVLEDPRIDAVHLLTPLHLHAEQSIATMRAAKHCGVAVTSALSMGDLRNVVRAQAETGRTYMMMETAAYTRPAIHLRKMVEDGEFGAPTFGRGAQHEQWIDAQYPWSGLPPMWYSSHALGPLLHILGAAATSVRALGGGRLSDEEAAVWGNPYPLETAIYETSDPRVCIEITKSLAQTVRGQIESFSLYSDRHGFDWARSTGDDVHLFHSLGEIRRDWKRQMVATEHFEPIDTTATLPEELRARASAAGGLYEGVPHLVHEFVRSIVEGRKPTIDIEVAANWTAAGLLAHDSAMAGGVVMQIPRFEEFAS